MAIIPPALKLYKSRYIHNTATNCADLPIEGATVYLNSVAKSITDINGKLVVGMLTPGPDSVKIQAPGFTPTDSDQLKNASFTI